MENAADYTKRLLRSGAKAHKGLGQNFLIDDSVVNQIANISNLRPETFVVEIGPGLGTLTRILAQKVNRLWAVELDAQKINILEKELKGLPVELIQADALKLKLTELWGDHKGYLVGNLPYYITSPLLMHFLEQADFLEGMTIMVQKEVAERIAAKPGGKTYGVLSIAVQLYAEIEQMIEVPPQAFWPSPKVTSAVLKLRLRPYPEFEADRASFFKVVKAAFSQRRKTVANSLAAGLGWPKEKAQEILQAASIDNNRRAETISIHEYEKLTQIYNKAVSKE